MRRREKRLAAIQAAKARLIGGATRLWVDLRRARSLGMIRNTRGGQPYKRAYGELEPMAQTTFHRCLEPDHEDQQRGVPALLQRADLQSMWVPQGTVATQVGPQSSDQGQLVGMLD